VEPLTRARRARPNCILHLYFTNQLYRCPSLSTRSSAPPTPGLCANEQGFSLHAEVCCAAHQRKKYASILSVFPWSSTLLAAAHRRARLPDGLPPDIRGGPHRAPSCLRAGSWDRLTPKPHQSGEGPPCWVDVREHRGSEPHSCDAGA
jgi:hypothetical protein